jgi:SAM-dependent methyltransferase
VSSTIYRRPEDYDLEHDGDQRDIEFYRQLVGQYRPQRLLELACGTGRLTLPIASTESLPDLEVVGLELNESMLDLARRKLALCDSGRRRVTLAAGDMRTWSDSSSFDMVLLGCSSITHLLTLDDRLAVWRRAFDHLSPGGRFVVDVTMPNLHTFATSLETPHRSLVEVDLDSRDATGDGRLMRSRTTIYDAFEQRATIRFLYDKFERDRLVERYVSDFDSHVYFPDELRLLFMCTGFEIESMWADFAFRAPCSRSREIIIVGARPQ